MKKKIIAALLLLSIVLPLSAQEKGGFFEKEALVFSFTNILTPGSYNDGEQLGIGLKGWLSEKNALRALVHFEIIPEVNPDPAETHFGLGVVFEHHFRPGKVSPYLGIGGGLLSSTIDGTTENKIYAMPILGAEMPIMDLLNIYGEYQVQFLNTSDGLYADDLAVFGFILYF